MPPTQKSDAPSLRINVGARLRVDEHARLASKKGADTVAAAAALHGMNRTVLFDYRSGRKTPQLAMAMKMAADLDTTVEKLFELHRRNSGRKA